MTRNSLLYILLGLIVVIAAAHFIALALFLYWLLPWFDIVMHFLGGLFVGLLLLWITFLSGYIEAPENTLWNILFTAVLGTIVIGLAWEAFEYSAGIPIMENYQSDTILDLVMDIVGAFTAAVFFMGTKKAVDGDSFDVKKPS